MARITLDHIRHAYGIRPSAPQDYALREVHHEWADSVHPVAARPRRSA